MVKWTLIPLMRRPTTSIPNPFAAAAVFSSKRTAWSSNPCTYEDPPLLSIAFIFFQPRSGLGVFNFAAFLGEFVEGEYACFGPFSKYVEAPTASDGLPGSFQPSIARDRPQRDSLPADARLCGSIVSRRSERRRCYDLRHSLPEPSRALNSARHNHDAVHTAKREDGTPCVPTVRAAYP